MRIYFIEAKDLKEGLGIPYPPNYSPTSKNIGYFDIKSYPEKIDLLPELQGWSDLTDLIVKANNPKSIFRTLRCDVSSSKIKLNSLRHKITSYVTFAFEILEWNGKENFKLMHDEFLVFVSKKKGNENSAIEFELIPTSYNNHNYIAWSVDVWNHGYGHTEKKAKLNWLHGLNLIKEFVIYQNSRYGNQLLKDRLKAGDV